MNQSIFFLIFSFYLSLTGMDLQQDIPKMIRHAIQFHNFNREKVSLENKSNALELANTYEEYRAIHILASFTKSSPKRFHCMYENCKHTFTLFTNLKRHYKDHDPSKMLHCLCGYKTTRTDMYNAHSNKCLENLDLRPFKKNKPSS